MSSELILPETMMSTLAARDMKKKTESCSLSPLVQAYSSSVHPPMNSRRSESGGISSRSD